MVESLDRPEGKQGSACQDLSEQQLTESWTNSNLSKLFPHQWDTSSKQLAM